MIITRTLSCAPITYTRGPSWEPYRLADFWVIMSPRQLLWGPGSRSVSLAPLGPPPSPRARPLFGLLYSASVLIQCWTLFLWFLGWQFCYAPIPAPSAGSANCRLKVLWLVWCPNLSTWSLVGLQKMATLVSVSPITRALCCVYYPRFYGVSTVSALHLKCPPPIPVILPRIFSSPPHHTWPLLLLTPLIPSPPSKSILSPLPREILFSHFIASCFLAFLDLWTVAWLTVFYFTSNIHL